MQKRRLRQSFVLLAAAAFVVAACGTSTRTLAPSSTAGASVRASARASAGASAGASASAAASPGGSPNAADQVVYAKIEAEIEAIRGLQHKSTVTPVLLDSNGVRNWLVKANAAQTDHAALANESKLFSHLGLLPAGSSLEQMELDLEAGQVVGFYDPVSKGLYVLSDSGGVGPVQKITFSHEYTHTLQDQAFGLGKLAIDTPDQGDRDLARTALPEGDATLAMTLWATRNMSLSDLTAVAMESLSGPQTDQLAKAPKILRETLMFPYQDGLKFVQGIHDKGGWAAVDRLYTNPPDSTSQILHPDLYANRVKPVAVEVPVVPAALGNGWKLTMQDTLGELQLRIWLEGGSGSANSSSAAAGAVSSWAGDRAALYEGPNGQWVVVLNTAWHSSTGRDAFDAAATLTLDGLGSQYRLCGDSTHVNIAIASSETLVPEFIACNTMG